MRCERYWREGILLVEQGRPDPHRDDCLDCRREHEARAELVRTFDLVGARGGDPRWQARVWRGIADAEPRPAVWVPWVSAFAAACALIAFVWAGDFLTRDRGEIADDRPSYEVVPTKLAMRSTSAGIGDLVRIKVLAGQEARLYRAEKLVLRCTSATEATTPGCSHDAHGIIAEHTLKLPGDYQLVIVPLETARSPTLGLDAVGALDRDLAAITDAGITYQMRELTVR